MSDACGSGDEYLTIGEIGRRFRSGSLGPVELTEALLHRIERLDPTLHAFVKVTRDRALDEAAAAEAAFGRGEDSGPLQGIPYAAKDLFDVAGEPTAAGTRLLRDRVASADCTVVHKLSQAGMVLLGKTHTVPLGATVLGINHELGTPHNPWARDHLVPGGSSSGSAVAVAAGLVPMALGTDTGGSIRAPAALCGVVGLKTTVGRVSRAGVRPLSTMDSVGPLTRSVAGAAAVLEAIHGEDPADDATRKAPPLGRVELAESLSGHRIAVGETVLFEHVDPGIERIVRQAVAKLSELGAGVEPREIPELAEAEAVPGKFRCISVEGRRANRDLFDHHREELDPAVLWMESAGEVPEAEFQELLATRERLRERLLKRWNDVDVLVCPTTLAPAAPVAEVDAATTDWARRYVRNTFLGNFLGLCGVSVPCGFTGSGLPVGMMVYAPPFREDLALQVAYAYQRATPWSWRHPDLEWCDQA